MVDVTIRPRPIPGQRGTIYDVYWKDTNDLICSNWEPHYTTCRALQTLGYSGIVTFWRDGKFISDMHVDIDAGAKLTIQERSDGSLRTIKHVPFDRSKFTKDENE